MSSESHKELIKTEFTKQAVAYSTNVSIADPRRIARLVDAIGPSPSARVLEVATGPGHVALGFARAAAEVVGIDLTPALIETAERQRLERGIDNARFQLGDAEHLPFVDGEFDVVFCRLAVHHFPDPSRVLREMTRVCRADGTVAIEDLIVPEQPDRATYRNEFERLRDSSHTRALPVSELLRLMADVGLEIQTLYTDELTPDLEGWLATTKTPPETAAVVRQMIERDAAEDLSGAQPFRENDALYFHQRLVALLARPLPRSR